MKIDYSLGEPPQSDPLQKDQYTIGGETGEEISEGIYIEFDIPEKEKYWATRVYIEGLGAVAESVYEYKINNNAPPEKGCFFYPFVEAEKEYTIRFVFLRHEDKNEEGFVIDYQGDDGIIGWFETKVKAGKDSKGEVRFTSKGKIDVKKSGEFRFTEKPKFSNEHLLTVDDNKWSVELGLVEGVSWEHGDERRTYWRTIQEPIPSDKLTETINLYRDQETEEYSIDFICVRPIMYYEHNGKTYKYQWESFVQDIYYPPRNPDGIYLEVDLPKKEFSRCDIMIDGIGKVAEQLQPLNESKTKGCFFYPFVEANKEYTIRFSFKKPEPTDSAGFTLPTPGSDTLTEVTKTVTAGVQAKGEVRLENRWAIGVDPYYNLHTFEKFYFENENLLTTLQVEIGLMEGISWDHGTERMTKWHCAVTIPNNTIHGENRINLRELCEKEHGNEQFHQTAHEIDCLCVRPIMFYKYGGKEYKYMWDGFAYDVYYPPKSWFEKIDINDLSQLKKINGTWKSKLREVWYFDDNIYKNENETLEIDSSVLKITTIYEIMKPDSGSFTEEEKKSFENEQNYINNNHLCIRHGDYNCDSFHSEISNDDKVIFQKYVCQRPLSQYFEGTVSDGMWNYNYKLSISKDGKILRINRYGEDNPSYENYYKQ